jgi:hypothetical protein
MQIGGDSPGFIHVMDPEGKRFYEPIDEVAESTEQKYSLSEFRDGGGGAEIF